MSRPGGVLPTDKQSSRGSSRFSNAGDASTGAVCGSAASSLSELSCMDFSVSPSMSSLSSPAGRAATGMDYINGGGTGARDEIGHSLPPEPQSTWGDESSGTQSNGAAPSDSVPFVGLINEGCTCYLNSLLQMLFHLRYFRNAVYLTPTDSSEEGCSIPRALQSVFHEMEERSTPVHTKKLTAAFDWSENELYSQHDIQEMATLLRDNLEERMKGTISEGAINRMFEGCGEQVVATLDNSFCSRSRDTFYDIHLPLEGHTTLMESLRSLTAKDMLVGDNKYRVEEPGRDPEYKEAQKSYEFRRFPPVIWFHLKRFEMDLKSPLLETKKVNSYLEFPVELSLEELERGPSHSSDQGARGSPVGRNEQEDAAGEESGEATRKVENRGRKVPVAIEQPFSKDSPAIYDLQGVIVHKGSVRSGHYYCYIREWDPVQEKFTRWLEFDDERVTVVSKETAVNGNFGVKTPSNEVQLWVLPTNNAYMLSYVRRGDCKKMFEVPKTNIVPQCVRDQLQEEILEEKRFEEEMQMRRKKLVLFVLTDEIIRDYVKEVQRETFPTDARIFEEIGIRVEVKKTTPLHEVYSAVALHVPLSENESKGDAFRLWLSPWRSNIYTAAPLLLDDGGAECSIIDYLKYKEDDKLSLLWFPVYLQRRSRLPSLYVPGTLSIFVRPRSTEGASVCSTCTIALYQPAPINTVTFNTLYFADSVSQCFVQLYLYSEDDLVTPCEWKTLSLNRETRSINVNSKGKAIHSVRCSVSGPLAWIYLLVSNMHDNTIPRVISIPEVGNEQNHSDAPVLPQCEHGNVLIFLKYFNNVTRRIEYAGSAMVPMHATVADCGRMLLQLLGEDTAHADSLRIYEENKCRNRPLCNQETLADSHILVGGVLIAQRYAPDTFPYQDLNDYLCGLQNLVYIKVSHIFFEEPQALRDGSSEPETAAATYEDDVKRRADPVLVESIMPTPGAGNDVGGNASFYPPRVFHVVKTYMITMNIHLNYEEVCESIGEVCGHDPAFIRLYRANNNSTVNGTEIMVPEVDPSPSEVPLERLLWKGWIPTIFFEVLPKPRRVVELSPRLIVTLYNHKNEAIYREKLVASPGATVGQSLACTLLRHARMFGQQAVTPPSVEGTVPGSGVGRSSEGHSTNSCGQNALTSRQTPPSSSFGSHYLVLQVDPHECVIRKLFEMPVREDGTLDCDYPLGDMLSESPSTFNGGGVSTAVEPLVLSIVPAAPLPNDHFRLPCCHGEMFLEREGVPPATFGQPFVVTVSNSITVKAAQELLLEFTGLSPSDVLPLSRGVFVFPGRMCASLRLEESILDFMRRELRTMNPQIPSLLLNHRQSGEKHGLRYLAQSSPALRISKR